VTEDIRTTKGKISDLRSRREAAANVASAAALEKRSAAGKQTARQRINQLLDEGSFVEFDAFSTHHADRFGIDKSHPLGDGVITGYGTIDGRTVAVYSQDFMVLGGSLGEVMGKKIVKVMDFALKSGIPMIGLNDSGGARIQEGVASLSQYGEIFKRNVRSSGVIPQISVILGPCAGGAVYSPAITDFTIMTDEKSHMFITGPDVIKAVTGEEVGMEELGGAHTHNTKSGNSHYLAESEEDALEYVKAILSYLPSNNLDDAPMLPATGSFDKAPADFALDSLIPDNPNKPYDMRVVVEAILDEADFLEVHALFAPNVLVGFGRIEGHSVGIIANQPQQFAGTLDIDASEKAARFVRTCDAFGIPVITLVDTPGFLPGTEQEWNGIIRRGAKLIYAYAEASVPLVTVITRKAFGGAYIVMGSKHLGADVNLAWPTSQVAVMGAQGAVNILFRREVAADPSVATKLVDEYEEELLNPYIAADRGFIDGVIEPSETRGEITKALRALRNKRVELPTRKHGNIPL
jgi:propionyl-CoA carboxylase beta chain